MVSVRNKAIERMFSSFKWIQDDRRNRLGNDKLVGITQIRMKVQKEHSKIIAERKRQKELLRMEAEKLWGPSDDAENASQVNIDGADDANSDDLLGVSSDEWTNLSHEWMEMLDGEEESDDDDALYDLESRITNLDTDDSVNEEIQLAKSRWDSFLELICRNRQSFCDISCNFQLQLTKKKPFTIRNQSGSIP
ncbi:hypothetical protein BKA69DRAFT_940818 [Paraphysoderma sedebokerense]|nr:hypothetical protein BKA69DRAFT_940818 [Paraphysoderma sedebokerense]